MPFSLRSKLVAPLAPVVSSVVSAVEPSPALVHAPVRAVVNADVAIRAAIQPAGKSSNATSPINASNLRAAVSEASKYQAIRAADYSIHDRIIDKSYREHGDFKPLTSLTGISDQRPVVMSVVDFHPLVNSTKGNSSPATGEHVPALTPYGWHFFEQWMLRRLVSTNIRRLVKELSVSPVLKDKLAVLPRTFSAGFANGTKPMFELLDAMSQLSLLKKAFDFSRYEKYSSQAFERIFIVLSPDGTTRRAVSASLADVFTSDMHFKENSFRLFTNTKVLFQLAYDLQHFLKSSSYDFVRSDVSLRARDDSSTRVVKDPTLNGRAEKSYLSRFTGLKVDTNSLTTNFILNADQTINDISATFTKVLRDLPTDVIERLSILVLTLSREWRSSAGLMGKNVRNKLTKLGLDPDSSVNIIDQLFGDIPDDVTEVVQSQNVSSLSNVLQFKDGEIGVLPFEQKYIETQNGTYTPGSAYLIDSILMLRSQTQKAFDVSRLSSFSRTLDQFVDAFNSLMNQAQFVNSTLSGPNSEHRPDLYFFNLLSSAINATLSGAGIDLQTGQFSGVVGDVLCSVISLAANDAQLKSLIFAALLAEQSIAPGQAPVQNDFGIVTQAKTNIVNRIADRVNQLLTTDVKTKNFSMTPDKINQTKNVDRQIRNVVERATTVSAGTSHGATSQSNRLVADDEIRKAFNDDVFSSVSSLFSNLSSAYDVTTNASGVSAFSKVDKGVLSMLVFEQLVLMLNRFGPSKFNKQGLNVSIDTDSARVQNFKLFANQLAVSPDMQEDLKAGKLPAADAYDRQLKIIAQKLSDEEKSVKRLYVCMNGAIGGITSRAREVISSFDPTTGKYAGLAQSLATIVPNNMLSMIDEQQVLLTIKKSLEVAYHALSPQDNPKFIDDSIPPTSAVAALLAMASENDFMQARGENVRVLSVGIPSGFSQRLQERVKLGNVKDATQLKQSQRDVIRVSVYKKDLENADIVFSPKTFVFELSRFVSPSVSFEPVLDKSSALHQLTFSDVTKNARLLELDTSTHVSDVNSYFVTPENSKLYSSSEYDFMRASDKDEMVRNHIVSELLGVYVKMLTGISLDESSFSAGSEPMTVTVRMDPVLVKSMIDERVKSVAKVSKFDSSQDSVTSLGLPAETEAQLAMDIRHIGTLSTSQTTFSDPKLAANEAVLPKSFERILNIPVDPDDFFIDLEKTRKTQFGQAALKQLIHSGKTTQVGDSYQLSQTASNKSGTVTLEQYFVTVETVLGSEA